MKGRRPFALLLAALTMRTALPAETSPPEALPAPGAIIQRVIERAAVGGSNQLAGAYVLYRTNITEQFSRRGDLDEQEELLLRVTVKNGEKEIDLLKINGQEPSAKDRERELRRFGGHQGPNGRDKPDRSRQIEGFMTKEILSRYDFTVQEREEVDGRLCLKLSFKPGSDVSNSGKLFERILDRIGGFLWIDETDYELVRADLQLREKVSLWGGFLGALEQLHMKIVRARDASGRWRDREVEARFVGRAVTRHIDVRTRDLSSVPQPIKDVPIATAQ